MRVPPQLAAAVIDVLVDQVGVLYHTGRGASGNRLIALVQDSFGEYLAARRLRQTRSAPELARQNVKLVAVGRFDSGWKYTVELAQRRFSPTRQELMDEIRHAALAYRGPNEEHVRDVLT